MLDVALAWTMPQAAFPVRKGLNAMKWILTWQAVLGSSLLATVAFAAPPVQPSSPPVVAGATQTPPASTEDREVQALLHKLSELSEVIGKNPQDPQGWRQQMAQADIMLQLAVRAKNKERDEWLRTAIDSYYSAAVQAPENDPTAYTRLTELPAQIARSFPGNPLDTYAMTQEIQADYMRTLARTPDNLPAAQQHLRGRLYKFAQEHPGVPDAAKAILEVAQLSEALGKIEDAKHCYRYLAELYAGQPLGRKANGSLWRLGMAGEQINLKASLLYSADDANPTSFDLEQLHGAVIIVYFWTSASERTTEDMQTIKRLTDRYQYNGLEAVYINLDSSPAKAREYLSGKLTAGTHLYQSGGLESPLAERFGIQSLPQIFLVGKDGKLIQHSLKTPQLEEMVTGIFKLRK
jgi:tetratricopeptide (TPR) repeat protein